MEGPSRCLFLDWFHYENYEIQLRLDYNFKPTVSPTLDADIRDSKTKQLIKKEVWHHTEKSHDPVLNIDIYDFRFENLHLRLYTITTAVAEQHISFIVGKKTDAKT